MRANPVLVLYFVAPLAACSGTEPSPDAVPAGLSMAPDAGYLDEAVPVVITGTGFLTSATESQGGGSPVIDTQTRAWLGSTELTGVTWVGTTTLNATVPAGLAPGTYDLTVENALGNTGTGKGAYTVLTTAPFAETETINPATVTVGQSLTLTVTVSNAGSAAITSFKLGVPSVSSPDGGSTSPPSPPPAAPPQILPGQSSTFSWTYTATAPGHVSISVECTGIDSSTGTGLTAVLATPAEVLIQPGGSSESVLTVVETGTGHGTVTSIPPGIANCGAAGGTCSAQFQVGATVTLVAQPAAGSSTSWAGCTPVPGTPSQCTVALNMGKTVTVSCAPAGYSVGGAVSGLAPGASLTLEDTGSDAEAINANGSFTFATRLPAGATYAVTVQTLPPGQTCTVARGTGIVMASDITNVSVSCTTTPGKGKGNG